MLIDKIAAHIFRESLNGNGVYIIDPQSYIYDVYTDMTCTKKIEDMIYELKAKIDSMGDVIGGDAPVSKINGRDGNIILNKTDLKHHTDDMHGLDKVDNTKDIDKLPSKPFQDEWANQYGIIKKQFDDMNRRITAYRNHISVNGGSPSNQNPHRVSLLGGVYYKGKVVKIDPNKFIRNQIVHDDISSHNISSTSHPSMQLIIKPSTGTLSVAVDNLSNKVNALMNKMVTMTTKSITSKITYHDSNKSAHSNILSAIASEHNRLQTIHSTNENPRYEYVRYRIDSINNNQNYSREYPSVRALNDVIFKMHTGISFSDKTKTPHIIFNTQYKNIIVRTSSGKDVTIPVNTLDASTNMELKVNRKDTTFTNNGGHTPAITVLSLPSIIGYKNVSDKKWNEFKLKLNMLHNSNIISSAKYDKSISSATYPNAEERKHAYDSKYPGISLTSLFFTDDDVFISVSQTFDSPEGYAIWQPYHNNQPNRTFNNDPNHEDIVEHINSQEYEKDIKVKSTDRMIGGLNLKNFPIRSKDGELTKSMISVDSNYDDNVKCISIQPTDTEFDIIYKSVTL